MDEYDRRNFIRTSIPGFLGVAMALPAITAFAARANAHQGRLKADGSINWDAFLSAIDKEAKVQHLDSWNEIEYVKKAAAIARKLNLNDPYLTKAFKMAKEVGLGNHRIDFMDLEEKKDYHVSLVQFEKEEEIKHHDHPEMTGVIICASGEVEVWNYDLLGTRSGDADHVLLKQTSHAMLAQGKVSTLTSKARNIHRLKAKKLTQLVDIFAPPYDKKRIADSTWFDVDPDGFKGKDDIFLAKKR